MYFCESFVFIMMELLSDSCPRQIETMWGAKRNHHWQHDLQADAEEVLNILVAETGQKKKNTLVFCLALQGSC